MGDSRAYPLLKCYDAADALALARRLCELMEARDPVVELTAELRTVGDARRMAQVLPHAVCFSEGAQYGSPEWNHGHRLGALPADPAELAALLPLLVDTEAPRGDDVEDRFVDALGEGPAAILWQGHWPDVPELDHYAYPKYEAVQAVFHADSVDRDPPADGHTVFVHLSKWGDLPRARWLADRVGGEVLGEVPGR